MNNLTKITKYFGKHIYAFHSCQNNISKSFIQIIIKLMIGKNKEIWMCLQASVIYFQQGKLIDLDKSGELKTGVK